MACLTVWWSLSYPVCMICNTVIFQYLLYSCKFTFIIENSQIPMFAIWFTLLASLLPVQGCFWILRNNFIFFVLQWIGVRWYLTFRLRWWCGWYRNGTSIRDNWVVNSVNSCLWTVTILKRPITIVVTITRATETTLAADFRTRASPLATFDKTTWIVSLRVAFKTFNL